MANTENNWRKPLTTKEEVLEQIEAWRQDDGAWGDAAVEIFEQIEIFLNRETKV